MSQIEEVEGPLTITIESILALSNHHLYGLAWQSHHSEHPSEVSRTLTVPDMAASEKMRSGELVPPANVTASLHRRTWSSIEVALCISDE
jgi:hypothetical protein